MTLFKLKAFAWLFVSVLLTPQSFAQDYDSDFIWKYFYIPELEDSMQRFGQASKQQLDPESIKVLVWNVYKAKKDNFHQDYRQHSEDKDLLLIQEAMNTPDFLKSSHQLTDFLFDFGSSFGYTNRPDEHSGTMLGSKVEPLSHWIARTEDLEPMVRTPKVLTMGIYPIEGHLDGLLVINIHGVNMTNHAAFERHLELAMAQVQDHRGPIIFGGDFNTRTKRRLRFMRELLIEQWGMDEMSFRNDERMRSFLTGHIIDFVFTKGLEVIDSEVLGHLESSDHKAMVFEARVE